MAGPDLPRPNLSGMPRLFNRHRFWRFAALLGTGTGQAAVAVLSALLMPVLLAGGPTTPRVGAATALVVGACVLGWLRQRERVYAEQLGQSYVQEIRGRLIRSALDGRGPSVGVTITRASNDLNSVRNWVALGIAPLAVAVPVSIGVMVALALLEPWLVVGAALTLAGLGVVLLLLAGPTYRRSREVRRRRGRLAGHLTDTASAAATIRAAGGVEREVRRVLALADKVIDASIERARVAGWARGAATSAATLSLLLVAGIGVLTGTPTATVAAAMTAVGVLAGPMSDLGRVVEYRQSFRAAVAVLGPAMGGTESGRASWDQPDSEPAEQDGTAEADGPAGLVVRNLVIDGEVVPDLDVEPGRVVVMDGAAERRSQVLSTLAGLRSTHGATILLDGHDLTRVSPRARRGLVGLAAPTMAFERSTIERAVRYRRPDSDQPVEDTLVDVGLASTLAALPRGVRTTLRHGGEPLDHRSRALLHFARATYADPPLILLDHLDRQLDPEALERVRSQLSRRRDAVVVVAADDPAALAGDDPVSWSV